MARRRLKMREIKFRFYCEYNGEYVMRSWEDLIEQFYREYDGSGILVNVLTGMFVGELMQYTGLKDENGVEIYEGDIINIDVGKKVITQIVSNISGMCFQVNTHENDDWECLKYGYSVGYPITVIGNIYENKELLK